MGEIITTDVNTKVHLCQWVIVRSNGRSGVPVVEYGDSDGVVLRRKKKQLPRFARDDSFPPW